MRAVFRGVSLKCWHWGWAICQNLAAAILSSIGSAGPSSDSPWAIAGWSWAPSGSRIVIALAASGWTEHCMRLILNSCLMIERHRRDARNDMQYIIWKCCESRVVKLTSCIGSDSVFAPFGRGLIAIWRSPIPCVFYFGCSDACYPNCVTCVKPATVTRVWHHPSVWVVLFFGVFLPTSTQQRTYAHQLSFECAQRAPDDITVALKQLSGDSPSMRRLFSRFRVPSRFWSSSPVVFHCIFLFIYFFQFS